MSTISLSPRLLYSDEFPAPDGWCSQREADITCSIARNPAGEPMLAACEPIPKQINLAILKTTYLGTRMILSAYRAVDVTEKDSLSDITGGINEYGLIAIRTKGKGSAVPDLLAACRDVSDSAQYLQTHPDAFSGCTVIVLDKENNSDTLACVPNNKASGLENEHPIGETAFLLQMQKNYPGAPVTLFNSVRKQVTIRLGKEAFEISFRKDEPVSLSGHVFRPAALTSTKAKEFKNDYEASVLPGRNTK